MTTVLSHLVVLAALLGPASAADLANGDDFSNNLFTDLAPLLSLFGERVTTQFLSQATGWRDCILLAMCPLGIITIMVSAIRVGGPHWLKALVGRGRENLAAAEMELMSSTSSETCELFNGQNIVRCVGSAEVYEFICVYHGGVKFMKPMRARIMTLDTASQGISPILRQTSTPQTQTSPFHGQPHVSHQRDSISALEDGTSPLEQEIILVRNVRRSSPNISLNNQGGGHRWELTAWAILAVMIQTGVLVYFTMATYHPTMRFQKEGEPVSSWALPATFGGTILLNIGILLCGHVVESSTKEHVYSVGSHDGGPHSAAMVWLQRKKIVGDLQFPSIAIDPVLSRQRIYESDRATDSSGDEAVKNSAGSWMSRKQTARKRLQLLTVAGALCGLSGYVIQFSGLREMHWSAAIAQLGAVLVLTAVRSWVRRHLGQKVNGRRLAPDFELEWLALSLAKGSPPPWFPRPDSEFAKNNANEEADTGVPNWMIATGINVDKNDNQLRAQRENTERDVQHPRALNEGHVDNLASAMGALCLRRQLGDLALWEGKTMAKAVALARSIELAMEFFLPHARRMIEHYSWSASTTLGDIPSEIKFHVRRTDSGWKAHIGELDAALSLWLYSATANASSPNDSSTFPPTNDERLRGINPQLTRCFQILGPSCDVLVRDLDWWAPNGLHGILVGNVSTSDPTHEISANRVGCSGLRWRPPSDKRVYNDRPAENEKVLRDLKQHDFQRTTQWRCFEANSRLGTRVASHPDFTERWPPPPEEAPSILLLESRDTIQRLFAKDLFSSFLWSMARCPDTATLSSYLQATISERLATADEEQEDDDVYDDEIEETQQQENEHAWKNLSLNNSSLSHLAQGVASTGLVGSESDAFLIIVPPLSSNDRLPGLNLLLQFAQDKGNEWEKSQLALQNAGEEERARRWRLAGDAYCWGLTIGATLPRHDFKYMESVAILMRYLARIRMVCRESRLNDTSRSRRHVLLAIPNGIERTLARVPAEDTKALDNFSQIHRKLMLKFLDLDDQGQMNAQVQLAIDAELVGDRRVVVRSRAGDIFGRTPGHHALEGYVSFFEPSLKRTFPPEGRTREEAATAVSSIMMPMILGDTDNLLLSSSNLGMTQSHLLSIAYPASVVNQFSGRYGGNSRATDVDGYTALHYVCMFPTPETATGRFNEGWNRRAMLNAAVLINSGADINARALDGSTPLHHAARRYSGELMRFLLGTSTADDRPPRTLLQAADKTLVDVFGRTPLQVAALSDSPDSINCLVGEDMGPEELESALFTAAQFDAPHSAKALVDLGADLHAREATNRFSGQTPFLHACFYGSANALRTLLGITSENFDRVEAITIFKDKSGSGPDANTCFHTGCSERAASDGNTEIVVELIAIAEDLQLDISELINTRDKSGNTPLMLAVQRRNPGLFEILHKAGADLAMPVHGSEDETMSLLEYAESQGCEDIADFIRRTSTQ